MSKARIGALVAVVVLAGAALALSGAFGGEADDSASSAYFAVQRGPLVISVSESGTIQNREQVVIKSEVEGRTTILYLIPEGGQVEPGTLLVELDSSKLQEQKDSQQITVINADAAFVRARENLAVAKSQAESDIAQAELDLRFAQLDLKKYQEGDYPQQLQKAEGEITIAREEVQRAKEKLEWSQRLHGQRYLSRTELQADELALKKSELELELAERNKKVLEEYTAKRDLEALQSDIVQAERALERTRRKASADVVQAEAELRAKESEFERQKLQLQKVRDQIAKCKIVAPVAGMVVHATTGSGSWRRDEEPLAEGLEVRERQELIHLPTAASMMAEVKVHESSLEKVRVGLPVRITVDAAAGRAFQGRLAKIAVLPDSQSVWLNPDLKVYDTEVHIEGEANGLRPGMSCKAEIYVDRYEDAVHVPVQCVVRIAGQPTVYVKRPDGIEARPVEIGLDNNRMVRVVSGLDADERVLLNPPLEGTGAAPAEDREVPEIPPEEAPAEKEAEKPAETPAAAVDWQSMTRDERKKYVESLPEAERRKLMEQFRQRRGADGEAPR